MADLTTVLPDELAPRPLAPLNGTPYELRLRAEVERTWHLLAQALTAAGGARLLKRFAAELFELASGRRPAGAPRRQREAHAGKVEMALREAMAGEGLPLKLACARVGVTAEKIGRWARADPAFASRLEGYASAGAAKLHGTLWAAATAKDGSERSAMFLLERQHGMIPRVQVSEVDESDVLRSKAWQRLTTRLMGALGPGHACSSCGGCECRSAVAEELGR